MGFILTVEEKVLEVAGQQHLANIIVVYTIYSTVSYVAFITSYPNLISHGLKYYNKTGPSHFVSSKSISANPSST